MITLKLYRKIYQVNDEHNLYADKGRKKIKLGFISEFFTNHTISKWFRGIIYKLDKQKFEIIVFHSDKTKKGNRFEEIKRNELIFKYENIIFLSTIKHEDNLRRISTFDLYLDTFPYNGHTGISDSLFQSCVPTISYNGKSFASRVSLSLLNTIKLPELVTFSDKEYFEKIDYYYTNKDQLKKIKKYLLNYKNNNKNRMKGFTIDFEKLIVSIFLKYNKKINV